MGKDVIECLSQSSCCLLPEHCACVFQVVSRAFCWLECCVHQIPVSSVLVLGGQASRYLGFNYLANLWNFIWICRNYVVQYILDLKTAWSSTEVMVRLEGNYAFLAMQKFSSNVVEKCLKLGAEEYRSRLVRELMTSPRLGQLLQDQYANYVIQSALSVCKVCISLFSILFLF